MPWEVLTPPEQKTHRLPIRTLVAAHVTRTGRGDNYLLVLAGYPHDNLLTWWDDGSRVTIQIDKAAGKVRIALDPQRGTFVLTKHHKNGPAVVKMSLLAGVKLEGRPREALDYVLEDKAVVVQLPLWAYAKHPIANPASVIQVPPSPSTPTAAPATPSPSGRLLALA